MYKYIIVFCSFFVAGISSLFASPISPNTNGEWNLMFQEQGVAIYYKSLERHDTVNGIHSEELIFKFINLTNQDLELSWFRKIWYDNQCHNCNELDDPEHSFNLILSAGECIIGELGSNAKNYSRLFIRFLDKPEVPVLSGFEFYNLSIQPL